MAGKAESFIAEEIAQSGPVSFPWFMGQALYHPDFGYYSSAEARVGREADFFTNVSVGPLFGRLLAAQFIEMWEQLGKPSPFTIVEQGANTGDFAADVLEILGETELFPALQYRIVEPLAALREQQARKLEGLECVAWRESLDLLEPFCGVHFSNELLDAMPVHLLRFAEGKWSERSVDYKDGKFVFVDAQVTNATGAAIALSGLDLTDDPARTYQTEVNLEALRWIDQVSAKLTRGFILTIDYGYPREEFFSPDRSGGTLTCYQAHTRSSNPLVNIGQSDITAHVEFTSLIERACANGMSLCGFTDQHRYMVGLAAPQLHLLSPKELRAFRTLMHPSFMGAAFKVLALQKGIAACLRGLS